MVQQAPVVTFDEQLATLPELARDRAGVRTISLVSHLRLGAPFGFGRGVDHLAHYEEDLGQRGRAVVGDALALLDAHRDDDLLLFVHLFDAHSPYTNFPENAESLVAGVMPRYPSHIYDSDLYHRVVFGEGGRDPRKREENRQRLQQRFGPQMGPARAAYQLGIRDVDEMLAELFEGMRAAGIYNDTTVVVFGDHGEEFFDHGLLTHTSLYLENLEVPVIVKVAAGSEWEALAAGGEPFRGHAFEAHTTVYRVVLDALGIAVPQAVQEAGTGGIGMEELLALQGDRTAVSELYDLPNSGLYQVSVVEGGHHAIVTTYLDEPGRWTLRDSYQEVYDPAVDPGEQRNLMGIKAAMAGQFLPGDAQQRAQQLREVSYRSQETRELTDEERAMLRALGYLE